MRKALSTVIALVLLLTLGLAIAPGAQATSAASPTLFSLECKLNSHAVGRVDISGFDVSRSGTKVDAGRIWWRSRAGDRTTQASWTPDRIEIRLQYRVSITGMVDNNDELWTSRGGGVRDGVSYPASKAWDPNGHYNAGHVHGRIYLVVTSLGGQTCASAARSIS